MLSKYLLKEWPEKRGKKTVLISRLNGFAAKTRDDETLQEVGVGKVTRMLQALLRLCFILFLTG